MLVNQNENSELNRPIVLSHSTCGGTKEMDHPCLIYLHAISSVPLTAASRPGAAVSRSQRQEGGTPIQPADAAAGHVSGCWRHLHVLDREDDLALQLDLGDKPHGDV